MGVNGREEESGYWVGTDIGGTFTDIVIKAPNGACVTRKVLSSPDDYSRAIIAGLRQLSEEHAIPVASLREVIHGTTVATNAILEHTGAKTALLTTRGFRDVLELRRLRTPQLYDLFYTPPPPIVERRLRLEITERIGAAGEVVLPLDEESVRSALERLRGDGVEAVAVCFLHSYRNPDHEHRVGALVREALPSVHLSLSVDVIPEIREYERTSTTVINAYIGPVVEAYLHALVERFEEADITARLQIMQSNGGVMSAAAAARTPAHIVESGPAAGVIAAHRAGKQAGIGNLISFDMGGTTAKASIIEDGRLGRTTEYEVGAGISLSSRLIKGGGHALKLPVLDIAEVGAGGGSIIWVDQGGGLKIGPRSAGASPGPACYGLGGTEPTITDANVVLGYIDPGGLAGGAISIDPDLAREALRVGIAEPLGMDLTEAAYGAYTVANAQMIRAIKAVSTYRGRDPRDFALLAFGGNGPVHAVEIARVLRMPRVIVPPAPGLFSAVGLLVADIEHDLVQTFLGGVATLDLDVLNATYARMETQLRAGLIAEGYQSGHIRCDAFADLRYVGQAYELTVPAPTGTIASGDLAALAEAFEREHERTYGHRATAEPIEIVNLRLTARVVNAQRNPPRMSVAARGVRDRQRLACFGPRDGYLATPVIDRGDLRDGTHYGPLIIQEYDATTVVPPGFPVHLDAWENIVIDVPRE